MPFSKFVAADYERMAATLEEMANLIRHHPEKNHHTSERLKVLASEMREDAELAYRRM